MIGSDRKSTRVMASLNFHHLRYFWTVAGERSVTRAALKLNVSQPTVSAQIRALEGALGEKLFVRAARTLALTDTGRLVYRYAEEIFGLGRELMDAVRDRPTDRPLRLQVGVTDSLQKLVAYRLLKPALTIAGRIQITCREGSIEALLADLAVHALDVVLADAPAPPSVKIRAFSHLLGESKVMVYGAPKLVAAHRRRFPRSLEGAPFLLPLESAALRRSVDQWFNAQRVQPRLVGEFEDSALVTAFGRAGIGLFVAPTIVDSEMTRQHAVRRLRVLKGISERFYAITVERRVTHPAVVAISDVARRELFL